MDAVQRDLNLLLTADQIDNGGLFIYTTLDPVVQKAATEAIEKQLSKIERQPGFKHPLKSQYQAPADGEDNAMPYLQGALVAIDNASGGIRALVGGRDYAQSKFNRALAPANRQIGSSFKPFVYTLAFMHGLLPGAAVSDGPIQPGEIQGAGTWSPGNSDGRYGGIKPVSYGLIQSRNTMSVRVGEFAGLDDTQKTATTLGLGDEIPRGAAIYIGSFETDLKDLTSAYTVFPNAGIRKQSYIIERIDDPEHKPIYRAAHVTLPVLDPGATWMTTELMEEVMTRGTAASARSLGFKLPAAGKTGTTNDFKDAWFVGFTSSLTCGVWVGFDQPATIIFARLRLGPRFAGLDPGHEQSVRALSRPSRSAPRSRPSRRPSVRSRTRSRPVAASRPGPLTRSISRSTKSRAEPAKCMAAIRPCSGAAWKRFRRRSRKSRAVFSDRSSASSAAGIEAGWTCVLRSGSRVGRAILAALGKSNRRNYSRAARMARPTPICLTNQLPEPTYSAE